MEPGHHGPSVIPNAIDGHALPQDFVEIPLLIASREQNQEVLRGILVLFLLFFALPSSLHCSDLVTIFNLRC